METENHYDIFKAVRTVLKTKQNRRESTVKHYRKKWYAAQAQALKEKRAAK